MKMRVLWILGRQFAIHYLRRVLFLYRPGGAKRFLANYSADRLPPFTAEEHELIPIWQRCTGCGLCEAACPIDVAPINQGRLTYFALASSTWRDPTIAHALAENMGDLAVCEPCAVCEEVCPEEIPLRKLARFVVRIGAATAAGPVARPAAEAEAAAEAAAEPERVVHEEVDHVDPEAVRREIRDASDADRD
jgi:ferredoxin